jgi:hypothetical protein
MRLQPDPTDVLAVPLRNDTDSGAADIRGYLKALLTTLYREDSDFSGKRPFGNSGWKYDLYIALGLAGMINITFDEDDYIDTLESAEMDYADELIYAAIDAL